MATTTPNFGWSVPTSTDLVKDGATAIELLGDSIDTSLVDLKGGTTGQVLSKTSGTDMDFTWVTTDDVNAIQNAIVDAKGDLIGATAADTPARLAVGANGTVLTADSGETTGLKWATPASGKVLQVVSTTKLDTFTSSSTTPVDVTGLSVSITPSSTLSKILVFVSIAGNGNNTLNQAYFRLNRDATDLMQPTSPGSRSSGAVALYINNASSVQNGSINYLDSPASTSALTYKIQGFAGGSGNIYVNRSTNDTNDVAHARGVSTITVMEIGA